MVTKKRRNSPSIIAKADFGIETLARPGPNHHIGEQ
jgi:hypothetical protein